MRPANAVRTDMAASDRTKVIQPRRNVAIKPRDEIGYQVR